MTKDIKIETLSKKDIIAIVTAKHEGLSKRLATDIVNDTFEAIVSAVAEGKRVQLTGFGSFDLRERAARTGRNPQTGEALQIEAKRVPGFKAGKDFRNAVK